MGRLAGSYNHSSQRSVVWVLKPNGVPQCGRGLENYKLLTVITLLIGLKNKVPRYSFSSHYYKSIKV